MRTCSPTTCHSRGTPWRRLVVRRERRADPPRQLADLVRLDPRALPLQPRHQIDLADHLRPADLRHQPVPAGEHDHRHDSRRHQTGLARDLLHQTGHGLQRVNLVRSVSVTPVQQAVRDPRLGPSLHVNHEHTTRTDVDHVHVRVPAARPTAIR